VQSQTSHPSSDLFTLCLGLAWTVSTDFDVDSSSHLEHGQTDTQ